MSRAALGCSRLALLTALSMTGLGLTAAPIVGQVASTTESRTPVVIWRGEVELHGWFFSAGVDGPAPVAILLHGLPGNPVAPLGLGDELASLGIHTLAFNFSGTHESRGDFSLRNTQLDIAAVFAFARDPVNVTRFGIDPHSLVLGGYSYGGGMALTFASNHDYPERVFAFAPSDSAKIARDMEAKPELEALYRQAFDSFGEEGTVRTVEGIDELLKDPEPWDLRLAAPRLADRRIFIASGIDDLDTPLETEIIPLYRELKASGNDSVILQTYPTDHSFGDSVARIAADIAAWMGSP